MANVGRKPKYKDWMPEELLKLGKEGVTATQVSSKWGIDRHTIHRWAHDSKHPEFTEVFQEYLTHLEAWWIDLGVRGIMGQIKGFQFTTYIYMMKCLFRENWLADQRHEVHNENNTTYTIKQMSDEELTRHITDKVNSKLTSTKLKIVPSTKH